jgi:hypothetical protein
MATRSAFTSTPGSVAESSRRRTVPTHSAAGTFRRMIRPNPLGCSPYAPDFRLNSRLVSVFRVPVPSMIRMSARPDTNGEGRGGDR